MFFPGIQAVEVELIWSELEPPAPPVIRRLRVDLGLVSGCAIGLKLILVSLTTYLRFVYSRFRLGFM